MRSPDRSTLSVGCGCFRQCVERHAAAGLTLLATAAAMILIAGPQVLFGSQADERTASAPASRNSQIEPEAGAFELRDVFVKVREESELPALERGQLQQFEASPGDVIESGKVLAMLDDTEAVLNVELAQIELQIAEKEHRESVDVAIATSTFEEAKQLLAQARFDAEAAKSMAESEHAILQAENDCHACEKDLERAMDARREFQSSVSEQQLSKLTLARDQSVLKLEQAKHTQTLELLRSRSKEAIVAQQESAVKRLENAVSKARSDYEAAELQLHALKKQVEIAQERMERRKLRAPFGGMIVEKLAERGEWVEAGEAVMRLIQLDTLYVDGFVDARSVDASFRGRKIVVQCVDAGTSRRIEGKIVFVSPEVDRVSQQVQVRAEISNPDSILRPGQSARMWLTVK